jgi:Zn finger protein HypA/HybF involved in hydrogenase expression
MHELALADAVIATALEIAEREGLATLRRVDVGIGELQQIRRDVFEFALREVVPHGNPRVRGTVFAVEIEPARLGCIPCGREFGLGDTAGPANREEAEAIHFIPELARSFLRCPACASPDFEVRAGRGVRVLRLAGEPG